MTTIQVDQICSDGFNVCLSFCSIFSEEHLTYEQDFAETAIRQAKKTQNNRFDDRLQFALHSNERKEPVNSTHDENGEATEICTLIRKS